VESTFFFDTYTFSSCSQLLPIMDVIALLSEISSYEAEEKELNNQLFMIMGQQEKEMVSIYDALTEIQ
jgi:hypothetical protein